MCRGPKKLQAFALWVFSSEVALARRCYPGWSCRGLTSANLNILTLKLYPEPATKSHRSPTRYIESCFHFFFLFSHFYLFISLCFVFPSYFLFFFNGLVMFRSVGFPVPGLARVDFSCVVMQLSRGGGGGASLKVPHFLKCTSRALCLHTHIFKCYCRAVPASRMPCETKRAKFIFSYGEKRVH